MVEQHGGSQMDSFNYTTAAHPKGWFITGKVENNLQFEWGKNQVIQVNERIVLTFFKVDINSLK